MKRREAIKLGIGVASSVALGGAAGCAPGANETRRGHNPENMDDYLSKLDFRLSQVREARFVEGFVAKSTGKPVSSELRAEIEPMETQFQNMMHTLLITQSFRGLSEEGQFHPGMQQLMFKNLESIDGTVFQVSDMLEKLDARQREDVRNTLRKHPGLAMRIAESLDGQAAQAGVSGTKRIQLRSMMTQASFRLANNDPGVVIDEYVDKIRRAAEPSRAHIAAAQIAAYEGGEAFWRYRDQLEAGGSGGSGSAASEELFVRKPGARAIRVGAKLMGIGVLTAGISGIFVSLEAYVFVVGLTVGAVLFAIGLITLIVGALIRVSSR